MFKSTFLLLFAIVSCPAKAYPFINGIPMVNTINRQANNADELVFVQSVWRHGARAPLYIYKNDPNQEDSWKAGIGNLLPNGMIQCLDLGKKLRLLYDNFIGKEYISKEIYIRSSDTNRTLQSATSNLMGLFANGDSLGRRGIDYPDSNDWPLSFVPIPVHSIVQQEDDALLGYTTENCPRFKKAWELVVKSPEYTDLVNKYKDAIKEAEHAVGEKIDMNQRDAPYYVVDEYFINNYFKKKPIPGYTPELYNQLVDLNNLAITYQYGLKLKPLNETNLALEMSKPMGGTLLWEIIERMHYKAKCLDEKIKQKNQQPSADCKWIDNLKYYGYSAHDSTLTSLFTTFNFPESNYNQQGYPSYASCVTFELWRSQKTNEYYVRTLYITKDNIADLTEDIKGCERGCTLNEFTQRSEPYKITNRTEYCSSDPGVY